jgi:hypothetical protein
VSATSSGSQKLVECFFQLVGLFSMFPNLLYRDSMSKYNDKEMSVAAKFAELIVSSGRNNHDLYVRNRVERLA